MMLYTVSLLVVMGGIIDPPFSAGDAGFYTRRAAFDKPGEVAFNIMESIGTFQDHETDTSHMHHQISGNLCYALFSRMELATGATSSTLKGATSRGIYADVKLPLLTVGRVNTSIAPSLVFFSTKKPAFGGNLFIDLVPFSSEQLPPLLLSNSLSLLRRDGRSTYQLSSVLTFHEGRFLPFLEFYSGFDNDIRMASATNTRLSTGLGFILSPFRVRAGVEIPLNEPDERDFDFRFSGELGFHFNTMRRRQVTISIAVYDAANDEPLDAKITLKGKEVERALSCTDGTCTLSGLVAGLYTIEIEHPGYRKVKSPLFVKDRSFERTFKLMKPGTEKGGE